MHNVWFSHTAEQASATEREEVLTWATVNEP